MEFDCTNYGLRSFVPATDFQAEVGDLIEIDRTLYSDWCLYVGDGNVVTLTGQDIPTKHVTVKLASLVDVAGVSGVRINNKEVPAKEKSLPPLPVDEVLQRALAVIGTKVNYNFLTKNCEHYVTEWKYGRGWSDQAATTLSVMKTLATDHHTGHNLLVNSLTAVLNSPGSPTARSPPATPTYNRQSPRLQRAQPSL
ncbi:phospholipid-metabolizing enzyme A-C1-like [Centruroides sculpturatus]|uniref:phospholipid-metabolizing enzyme A-C1-like n=1 Tax=Centruroides sculpturatus TaxID=218467 RepID=UPI000C6DD4F7|nr:phospholipid-metabolizing enzyme A-C1-like [Centruroides sculpturatus]XP_023229562.1 phospholipid-metabolizing enzyme A-C1-like [Centruroides sculpturatus]